MSAFILTSRLIWAVLISASWGFLFIDRNRKDTDTGNDRYVPVVHPMVLIHFFVLYFSIEGLIRLFGGSPFHTSPTAPVLGEVILHTSLYFALLLPLLPLLRRRCSARACAMLWLMPNVLYLLAYGSTGIPRPLLVVPINADLTVFLWFWGCGAAAVMAWRIVQHLRFRRELLSDARECGGETAALWEQEKIRFFEKESDARRKIPLLASSHTATPLSIGLNNKSLRVVLPERSYSTDELHLIFRHELIHISRFDAQTKLFLTICTAVMWWNPLMWLAMRRCADDLELGCDEFVLLDEPQEERDAYANLLLKTAGDERGFTTCLSATSKALRYRLENVLRPKKKLLGGLMLALVSAAMIWTCGDIAIGYAPQTLRDIALDGETPQEVYAYVFHEIGYDKLDTAEAEALWAKLSDASVYTLTGRYGPVYRGETTELHVRSEGEEAELLISGRFIHVRLYREKPTASGLFLDVEFDCCFAETSAPGELLLE